MPDTFTDIYGLVKPEIDASIDTWGTKLNADLDVIDAVLAESDLNRATSKEAIDGADMIVVREGNVTKLTTIDAIRKGVFDAAVPEGTVMLFRQDNAPTGWTKLSNHNNKMLRVVSGSAGSGGSVPLTEAFKKYTPVGTLSPTTATGTVGATTLSLSHLPAHSHSKGSLSAASHSHPAGNLVAASHSHSASGLSMSNPGNHTHTVTYRYRTNTGGTSGVGAIQLYSPLWSPPYTITTTSASNHTHTISGSTGSSGTLSVSGNTSAAGTTISGQTDNSGGGGSHTHSFTGVAHNHEFTAQPIDLSVKYVDLILARKDAN